MYIYIYIYGGEGGGLVNAAPYICIQIERDIHTYMYRYMAVSMNWGSFKRGSGLL